MNVRGVKQVNNSVGYGVSSVSSGSGGSTGGSFRDQLGGQLKDDYRARISVILDEMAGLSEDIPSSINLQAFERFLSQIRSLLTEIIKNAYVLDAENILDLSGRQRIFASVGIVDQKLDDLAKEVLNQNSDRLDYLSKVDEIRGLVMDMLL